MIHNRKLARIIVPLCIAMAIAGIWVYKNVSSKPSDPVLPAANADFVLTAESIDLDALTAYGLPMIIDFGSDSCIPCQQMAPVLKTMNERTQGKAIVKFIDVWKYPAAAQGFPIQVIPTQVLINADGTPYTPSEDMEIEFTMYSFKETGKHAFTVHQGGLSEEQMGAILADMGVPD